MSSRRDFLQKSAIVAGGSILASALNNSAFAIFKSGIAPSDQLNIGAIGINGMGWADVTAALKVPGVNLVAVCDIDDNVVQKRLKELSDKNYDTNKLKRYTDY